MTQNELTMGEVARRLGHIEAKLDSRVVFQDVYNANRKGDQDRREENERRLRGLEDWRDWAQRAIFGAFVTIGVQVIVTLLLVGMRLLR